MTLEEKRTTFKEIFKNHNVSIKAGDMQLIDMEYVDYSDNGVLTVRVNIPQWQRNPAGSLHGGMHCYYMDTVAGAVSAVEVGEMLGTMDLHINFIRGVFESSDHIFVKAKVISIGRRVVVTNVEIRDPEDWLMSSGTGNFMRFMPADDNPTIVQS